MITVKGVAENFANRGIECSVFDNIAQVKDAIRTVVEPGDRVAMGGSITLQEIGLYEQLQEMGHEVLWHWRVAKEEMDRVRRQAMTADVYFTSSNAIIEDGRLLNIDGHGNRVAAMIYGPKRVVVIAGRNKLAADYEAALLRIQTVACPKNAERLNRDVPCRYTGKCQDCRSPQRMCQITAVIANQLDERNLRVWLVNQDLGY